ncbi:hypothetical protein JCM13591A_37600 [Microbacterium xylanilyticum]
MIRLTTQMAKAFTMTRMRNLMKPILALGSAIRRRVARGPVMWMDVRSPRPGGGAAAAGGGTAAAGCGRGPRI